MSNNSGRPESSKEFYQRLNNLHVDEFLQWFRIQTDIEWEDYEETTFEQYQQRGLGGSDWQKGTEWLGGYEEDEINCFEEEWGIVFPEDYRRFLINLGSPTKELNGAKFVDGSSMAPTKKPSYYDWRKDKYDLKKAFDWPLEGILDQVKYGLWVNNWGAPPDSEESRLKIANEKIAEAPKLIPIYGHRYLIDSRSGFGSLVLSVYGRDIIVYGTTLKHYLVLEFSNLLNINHERAYEFAVAGYAQLDLKSLPLWGDIILGNYDFLDDEE